MKKFGRDLNGISEPHKRESHIGRVSTVGSGGRSVSVDNANNSQLRNLVPVMPYGISSSPPTGLMAFVLVADNSGRDGIVGVYDPNKPLCKSGECIMYSSSGATVKCSNNKVLLDSSDGATVKCNGGRVLLNGRDVLEEIDNLYNMIV